MEKIQRIRRRKTQEAAVEMVINILENKIGPRFSAKKKIPTKEEHP